MIDHNELMQEMEFLEKIPRNERVILAHKRRKEQLTTHTKWMKTEDFISTSKPRPKNRKGIKFSGDIELMDIASRNAQEEMRDLLKTGADPNQRNHDGLTALHQCCIDGSLDMVTLLLKSGANVNVKDRDLWTPLHAAATCGHFKIVTLLIKAGADLTAINGDGDMPHDIAEDEVMQQYIENELVKMGITDEVLGDIRQATRARMLADINDILSNEGDLNQPLDQGGTLLHAAIANSFNDVVELLLKNGASISARDEDGWEPIHAAAYWCNEGAFDMLVEERNIDIRSTTDNGETPYELCEDPELKLHIIETISSMTRKYGSVKTYTSPDQNTRPIINREPSYSESDDEMSSRFDDYEDTVTDTLIFNLPKQYIEEDQEKENNYENEDEDEEDLKELQNVNTDEATLYPLLNLEASELSERRNSVKEAKHLAPIKRANSLDRHYRPQTIRTIQEGNENDFSTETTDKVLDDITNLNVSSNRPRFMESEMTSTDTKNNTSSTMPMFENTSHMKKTPNNQAASGITNNGSVSNHNPAASLIPRESEIREPVLPEAEGPYSKTREPAPSSKQTQKVSKNGDLNKDNKRTRILPLTQLTLLDLKRKRQEARQTRRTSADEGDSKPSQSTFYNVPETYVPPPSPTMIRYHFRMTTDQFVNHSIIKEKKCSIM